MDKQSEYRPPSEDGWQDMEDHRGRGDASDSDSCMKYKTSAEEFDKMLQRLAAEKVPSYHDAGSDCGSMTGYLPKPRKSQRDSSTHGQSTFPQKTDREGHLRRPESKPRRGKQKKCFKRDV